MKKIKSSNHKRDIICYNDTVGVIRMNVYMDLFFTFMRVGGFTFGGGISMLPMLEREIVEKKKWATQDEILDYFAIGQCTPGIIAVNVATFVGYKYKGIVGGIIATAGMVTPSLLIILGIAVLLEPFMKLAIIQSAFAGIRVGVCVIILQAIIGLWKKGVKDSVSFILFAISFIVVAFLKLSPIYVVIMAFVLGSLKVYKAKRNAGDT